MLRAGGGVEIRGIVPEECAHLLSDAALRFIENLHFRFESVRLELLQMRRDRVARGTGPEFLRETAWIRAGNWKGPSIPHDLRDRRVEITGPVDRKVVINAMNSGAKVFMADFEDSTSPTFENLLHGQNNLFDAVRRRIELSTDDGKLYKLKQGNLATLMVRPRGWHLVDWHIEVGGRPISGALFDFGLYFFHNAKHLIGNGSGPYFYLPKIESHLEARLWNDVFNDAQDYLGIRRGSIRATVLIETINAAFEMDEILFELRSHSAGLNCGRWDYIFSYIKKFKNNPNRVLPDRDSVTMKTPFMEAYVRLLIQTCHKRGVHAMGGMAAQIPIKNDKKANEAAMAKVFADKQREVLSGHDGTWVAHPALIPIAQQVFDKHMKGPNQIHVLKGDNKLSENDLLHAGTDGSITENGLKLNIDVGLRYLEAWLRGVGCVPIHNKMEDAATAEISRSQIWQWIQHNRIMDNGLQVTKSLVRFYLKEQIATLRTEYGEDYDATLFEKAKEIYEHLMTAEEFPDFLTLAAYKHIVKFRNPLSSL